MARPGLIDRQGLLMWADSIAARSELPRLIRRLILETGHGVVQLGFPASEGVSAASWDGTVRAVGDGVYVPQGLSLWELSVEKNAGVKANKDYRKRTTGPDGLPPNQCTYIAVSLRPWMKREDWARDRNNEGRWKLVRAFGLDDIETWLESAPITHAWLSELVGLHPFGLVTPHTWWDTWSSATTPAFPRAAVLAGRQNNTDSLQNEIARAGRLITIRGSSRDEVGAFVASTVLDSESKDGGALLAGTAFVDDVQAWRRLREHREPLVLLALNDAVAAEFAPGPLHTLIVPITGTTDADIELPAVDSLAAAEVLKGAGLLESQAEDIGKLARFSLLAARRHLANKPELHRPWWAQAPAVKLVRRLALIGGWNENGDADCSLVENIAGLPYSALTEDIAAYMATDDPFLGRVGGRIGVVSPFDAWLLLRGELRKNDLEAFHEAVRTTLTEIDPRLELPQEQRWRSSLLGKDRKYSHDLRRGLATTLALLGAYGDRSIEGSGLTGSEWASRIIYETLKTANTSATSDLWISLSDVLPLLAEAAPSVFLDAIRDGTQRRNPLLIGIFNDATNTPYFLTPDSAHSSFLWALETCAWSPDHFGLAVDLLARLAEIDPGGRLGNRPSASLTAIFLPWYPQNAVSADQRLAAIDGLRDRHPEVAWKLLLSLLPELHGISANISAPHFRDWRPASIEVTPQEYWQAVDEISARVLEDAGHNRERWVVLIDKLDHLPPPAFATSLAYLDQLSAERSLIEQDRSAIWEALRTKSAIHREFATAAWALPANEVSAMEIVAEKFKPGDPSALFRWLFDDQMPEIPDIKRSENFEIYSTELAKVRVDAASALAQALDWLNLRTFALSIQFPGILGQALAQAKSYGYEDQILQLLESDNNSERTLASGYFSQRFRDQGWNWLEEYLTAHAISPTQSARLLLNTYDYPKAWDAAEQLGALIADMFWREFQTYGLGHGFEFVDIAAQRLLNHERAADALDLVILYSDGEDDLDPSRAELVARCLEAILRRGIDGSQVGLLSHHLLELHRKLERSSLPRERVASLEWAYLPMLGIDEQPPALNKMLAQDPDFFVDIIRRVYRPRSSDDVESREVEVDDEADFNPVDEEQQAAIARRAYHLLSNWRTMPGLVDDDTVDPEKLKEWVNEARAKLDSSGHLEVGDTRIGHVLAWGPPDSDGARPCLAVRNLIERLQNSDLESGLRTELYNSRGVTTRGIFDGGDQERIVATSYFEQAKRFADRWPRTAALLRGLAEDYGQEARQLDGEAERRRKGVDN